MRGLWLVALGALLVGCGEPTGQAHGPAQVPTTASAPPREAVPAPDFRVSSDLAIRRGPGAVKVGTSVEDALAVFAEPAGSYERSELPPSIQAPFQARGWQSKTEGFGMILAEGRVAAALWQHEALPWERIDEVLEAHRSSFRDPSRTVLGKYVRYWFWESDKEPSRDSRVLMVCATELQRGKWNLSVGVGAYPVMQALGMTFEPATRDQKRADAEIEKLRSGKAANPANPANRTGL